ncbi:MAG: hypothetical protein JO316_17725 [Abitibacteriaceae bacterium]|nr:hypothetical protein [Abditibacteriaceae bacterium]
MLRIGIDGGGTTTRAVVIDENLEVLGRGEAPSSNHYSVGVKRAMRNIQRAAASALRGAHVPAESVVGWGFGLAGACTQEEQTMLRGQLKEHLKPLILDKPIAVDEDAAAAQAGAFAGKAGAVCIAGTGSNCFGINDKGERARADGLGPLLGDRGSGYWIGEEALRTACRAHDGTGPTTSLLKAVLTALQVASVDQLVQVVYQPNFEKDRIAALFPVVVQCAEAGDDVAHSILYAAGRQLAATSKSVLDTLCIMRIAVSGGVLTRNTAVRVAFEEALRLTVSHVQIQEPLYDATVGAALLTRAGVKPVSLHDTSSLTASVQGASRPATPSALT